MALFPTMLGRVAHAAGVEIPFNLVLFLGSLAMLIMLMQLSSEAGRLQERTRVLAEEVALLKVRLDQVTAPEPTPRHEPSPMESVRLP